MWAVTHSMGGIILRHIQALPDRGVFARTSLERASMCDVATADLTTGPRRARAGGLAACIAHPAVGQYMLSAVPPPAAVRNSGVIGRPGAVAGVLHACIAQHWPVPNVRRRSNNQCRFVASRRGAVAGVLHAGAAQRRQLRRPPLPRPALPYQHRLRPHLRQSRCCTRSAASSSTTPMHHRMLCTLQLPHRAFVTEAPTCTSSHSAHCSNDQAWTWAASWRRASSGRCRRRRAASSPARAASA